MADIDTGLDFKLAEFVLRQKDYPERLNFMAATKALLIIPFENQVRELDAKILFSCVAAQRGFSCIIGSRLELDFQVASFPRSRYLSKSMTAPVASRCFLS